MAISAVMVPSELRPERQKHRRSNQLRVKGDLTPTLSRTALKGLVICIAVRGPPGIDAKDGRYFAVVRATPGSARSAAAGMASTAAARGFIASSSWSHSATAPPPPLSRRMVEPKAGVWMKSP